MPWTKAASLDDLPPGASLEFWHEGRLYALFRVDEVITCLDGHCPHQGGRLASGLLSGSKVTCPRRGCLRWTFDVQNGASSVNAWLTRRLYPVRVEGRAILVALPGG